MFTVTKGDGRAMLRLSGELDLAEADGLIDAASAVVPDEGDLVLDLTDLTFIDSSGVRGLVTISGLLHGGGRLILHDPAPAVRRVLDLVGIGEGNVGIVVRSAGDEEPQSR
jgi:anti-sigma B factor antagonist